MTFCKKKRIKKTSLCAGDMDKFIAIQTRALSAPAPGSLEATEGFVLLKNVWAAAENDLASIKGIERFADVNTGEVPTHIWYIWYDPDLNLEVGNNFVLWESKRYRILSTRNDNENDQFISLICRHTGDDDKDAAEA